MVIFLRNCFLLAIILQGWGTTSAGGSSSDKLLEVEVPIVSNEVCDKAVTIADVKRTKLDYLSLYISIISDN